MELEEIDHITETDPVIEVSQGAGKNQSQGAL
jgi:hypothetical protein